MSPKRKNQVAMRAGSIRPVSETLAPLMEGPTPESYEHETQKKESSWNAVKEWVRGQLERSTMPLSGSKKSDLRLLLGVLGSPLAPIAVNADLLPHLSIKDICTETSSAQYIVHQYIAATGCAKLQNTIKSSYVMGRMKMVVTESETATKVTRNSTKATETGCFVLWQMMPDMWSVELVLAGIKVHAGSNGKVVWRHTPWLGSHAAKGPVRPLRRALQFAMWVSNSTVECSFMERWLVLLTSSPDNSVHQVQSGNQNKKIGAYLPPAPELGEKRIGDEDCFILKLAANPSTLADRSDGPAEIIKHVFLGYFSQRTGLLAYMEDSHLTRIQAAGADVVYWETTIESTIEDYRAVDGVMIAHSGRSVVTLFRFGEVPMSHTKTRMEEIWTIEDVVFNVPVTGIAMKLRVLTVIERQKYLQGIN
eukprot:Gb_21083 [translate_table: standard]